MRIKNVFTGIMFIFLAFVLNAQDTASKKTEMADLMRSNGKIYVVVTVVVTILAGLILYVARLDRKITKLEKSGSEVAKK